MKRVTKEIKKRTFALKNALPRFVSIVDRGANFIPLSEVRFSDENEKYANVEINKIEFSKAVFKDKKSVETYMETNNYEDFSIEETEETFYVPGVENDKFTDIQAIEYDEGVLYSVGKLKEEVADSPVTAITDAEIIAPVEEFSENQEEQVTEEQENEETVSASEDSTGEEGEVGESTEAVEEVKEEVALSDGTEVTVEETVSASESDAEQAQEEVEASEEVRFEEFLSSVKFNANASPFREQMENLKAAGVIFTFDSAAYSFMECAYSAVRQKNFDSLKQSCNDFYSFMFALSEASANLEFNEETIIAESVGDTVIEEKFSFTKEDLEALIEEKLTKFKENNSNTIDETEIVIQNSQRIQTDEVVQENDKTDEDKRVEKFNADKTKDLFGIR